MPQELQPYDENKAQPVQGLDALRMKVMELLQNRWHELSGPDPTAGVMPMMIPTAKNLPIFAQKMRDLLQESTPLAQVGRSPIEALKDRLIQTYMSVRYPNRAAIPRSLRYDPFLYNQGEFRPGQGEIVMNTQPTTPLRQASTLGHETQHAVDYSRNPEAFKDYPQWPGYRSDEYTNAYLMHPTEVAAREAGQTTSRGLGKLLSLINQAHPELVKQTPGMIDYGVTDVAHSSPDFVSMMYDWLNKGR